jgi:hypothetical protein
VLAVIKLAAPLFTVALLAMHQLTTAFAAPPIGLTNLAGSAADCTAPAANAVCASLFHGGAPLYPGGPAQTASVTIGYHAGTATSAFGVYLPIFASRASASAPMCSAADPASKLDLLITQGAHTVYQGTLADFALAHHDPASMLHLAGGHDGSGAIDRWANGDQSNFTIAVTLDSTAGNPYMGCVSSADIAWLAAT